MRLIRVGRAVAVDLSKLVYRDCFQSLSELMVFLGVLKFGVTTIEYFHVVNKFASMLVFGGFWFSGFVQLC